MIGDAVAVRVYGALLCIGDAVAVCVGIVNVRQPVELCPYRPAPEAELRHPQAVAKLRPPQAVAKLRHSQVEGHRQRSPSYGATSLSLSAMRVASIEQWMV